MTVGSGISPDLLTLPDMMPSRRSRAFVIAQLNDQFTAGEEFHLALRTLPKTMLERLYDNEAPHINPQAAFTLWSEILNFYTRNANLRC